MSSTTSPQAVPSQYTPSTKVFAFVHPYGPTRTRALLLSDRALMPMAQGLPHE